MSFIVACCLLLIQCEFCLHAFKLLLCDQCGHCTCDFPQLWWRGILSARRFPQRVSSRSSDSCRAGSGATNIQLSGVNRIGQNATQRCGAPSGLAAETAVPMPTDALPN